MAKRRVIVYILAGSVFLVGCSSPKPSTVETSGESPSTSSAPLSTPVTTVASPSTIPTSYARSDVKLGTADETPPPSVAKLASASETIVGHSIARDGTIYVGIVDAAVRGRDCTADLYRVNAGSIDRRRIAEGILPALTPDGSTLAYVAPVFVKQWCKFERLMTMDTNTYESRPVEGGALAIQTRGAADFGLGDGAIESLQWSPDGTQLKFLFTAGDFRHAVLFDLQTRQTTSIGFHVTSVFDAWRRVAALRAIRWLPDGTMAARLMCTTGRCLRETGAPEASTPDPGWVHFMDKAAVPPYDPITDQALLKELCKYSRPADCPPKWP